MRLISSIETEIKNSFEFNATTEQNDTMTLSDKLKVIIIDNVQLILKNISITLVHRRTLGSDKKNSIISNYNKKFSITSENYSRKTSMKIKRSQSLEYDNVIDKDQDLHDVNVTINENENQNQNDNFLDCDDTESLPDTHDNKIDKIKFARDKF